MFVVIKLWIIHFDYWSVSSFFFLFIIFFFLCYYYYYYIIIVPSSSLLLLLFLSIPPLWCGNPPTGQMHVNLGRAAIFSQKAYRAVFSTMSYTPDHDKNLARILRNKRSRERVKRSDQDSRRQNSGPRLREQKLQRDNDNESGGHTGTEWLGNLVAVSSKVVQYDQSYNRLDARGADYEKSKPINNVTTPSQNTHALQVLQKVSYSTPPLSVPQKQQSTRKHSPTRESMIRSQNTIFEEFINGMNSSADTQQKKTKRYKR